MPLNFLSSCRPNVGQVRTLLNFDHFRSPSECLQMPYFYTNTHVVYFCMISVRGTRIECKFQLNSTCFHQLAIDDRNYQFSCIVFNSFKAFIVFFLSSNMIEYYIEKQFLFK